MLEEMYDLPDGWKWATVADVISDAQPGFASGKKDVQRGINHLRMNNIGADCQLNLDSVFTVPKELAKPRYLAQLNDVLVCHTNSTKLVGKAALFNVAGVYAFSNHLTRLRVAPDIIDPQWLWRVMATLWRERYFENRCKQWVNQATIERATLLAAPVPLPPLPEQRRTARDAPERVPALLKRFRQSVLASAFRGDLTERDPNNEPASALLERVGATLRGRPVRGRAETRGEGQPHRVAPTDATDLPELPDG
jgi:type I restriction enzyme S subunit